MPKNKPSNINIHHAEKDNNTNKRKSKDDAAIFNDNNKKKRKVLQLATRENISATEIPRAVQVDGNKNPTLNKPVERIIQQSQRGNIVEEVSEVTFNATPAQQWNDTQVAYEQDNDRMEREIDMFVKKVLFKKLKFITNPSEMQFSQNKKSLCQFSCTHLNIAEENRRLFWTHWNRRIEQTLSRRRSDINTGMKLAFIGKKKMNMCFVSRKPLTSLFFFLKICVNAMKARFIWT